MTRNTYHSSKQYHYFNNNVSIITESVRLLVTYAHRRLISICLLTYLLTLLIVLVSVFVPGQRERSSPVQNWHDGVGSAGIQSCGWFIQEQNSRGYDELHTDVDALTFTAGDSTDKRSPDLLIKKWLQCGPMPNVTVTRVQFTSKIGCHCHDKVP